MNQNISAPSSVMQLFKTNIFLIVLLLCNFIVFGQSSIPELEVSPAGLLDNIFDRYGNQYTLNDIMIENRNQSNVSNISAARMQQTCQAGIFNLNFEVDSGMENPTLPNHIARRTVLCQVFQDVSDFINTPLKNPGNTTRINICVRNITSINNAPNVGGIASGYFNLPSANNQVIVGGITDNEIYKTIHAGVDSYTNVRSPISISSGSGAFYHGMVAFNFNNPSLTWHTDLNQLAISPLNDLYTVALHEVLHALGFASQISADGSSNFPNTFNYYSRYDTFLSNFTNNPLVTTASTSPMYDYNFVTAQQNNLHPGCLLPNNINPDTENSTNCNNNDRVFFNSPNVLNMPVYTPSCYEVDSSLSHFEDQCHINTNTGVPHGNDNYFLMSNSNTAGTNKRFPTLEERNALCDLGYSLNTVYRQHNYANATICAGSGVAGINDGFTILAGVSSYSFVGNAGTDITITNLLGNDFNYENGGNTTANLRFEGLQDVYDNSSTITVTGGNGNNALINFNSVIGGIHLLRYVPFNTAGQRGNITYVYVFVFPSIVNCQPFNPNTCNLVQNGDFEFNNNNLPIDAGQINNACGWTNIGAYSTDYFHGNATSNLFRVPCNLYGFANDRIPNNRSYAGIFIVNDSNAVNSEMLGTIINTPLVANTNYSLSFDVSLANLHSLRAFQMQFLLTADINVFNTTLTNMNNVNIGTISGNIFNSSQQVINNRNGWTTLTFNFNSGNGGQEYLIIGGLRNPQNNLIIPTPTALMAPGCFYSNSQPSQPNQAYYYLDNVSLVPTYDANLNLPTEVCSTRILNDLSIFVQNAPPNGVFTGSGVTLDNNIYSFNATTAGVGTHTISYTYVQIAGCVPITITSTIEVLGGCGLPFISQTYVNNSTEDRYIEIKNKSENGFAAGTHYLAIYNSPADINGAPTAYIDIGEMNGLETKLFGYRNVSNPSYAPGRSIQLPQDFEFSGKQILIISTTNDATAYANHVDLTGEYGYWCLNKSLVRSSCATNYPRTDAFDINDWVEFALDSDQLNNPDSMTNAILTTHHHENLFYGANLEWQELNLPNNSSLPDKSRNVFFENDYDLGSFGNLEVCSLTLNSGVIVTVPATNYVSSEISVTVNLGANLDIQNGGSLIMVKDSYNGVSGPDLVQLNNGAITVTKRTNGLDAFSDWVYWSTPLTNNPLNVQLNNIDALFPIGIFSRNYLAKGNNFNWYDGFNYTTNAAGADGFDDDNNFWYRPTPAEKQQLMEVGQGYAVMAPLTASPSPLDPLGWNYNVNFVGQTNNGIVEVPVFGNNSLLGSNSNLVGNPYPSSINLDRLFTTNSHLIEPYAWIWGRTPQDHPTFYTGPYGYFGYYNNDNFWVYSSTMTVPSTNTFTNILSSCQSFYVATRKRHVSLLSNNGVIYNAGNLIFNNAMRSTDTSNTFARGASNSQNEDTKLWLSVKDDSQKFASEIGIAFLEKAKPTFDDNEDVKCFYGNGLNLYSKSDKTDLIINAQDTFSDKKTIALGINNLANCKKLSLQIEKVTGQLTNQEIFIFDRLTSKIVNISKENYSFESNAKIMDDRFTILFQNKIETEIGDVDSNKVIIFAKDGVVNINSLTNKLIQSVFIADLYTPSVGGIDIAKNENINNKMFSFNVDSKYKLLNIKVILEDGTVINKKIIP